MQAISQLPGIAGVHQPPVRWEEMVTNIVERLGLLPRRVSEVETAPAQN